MVKVNKQIKRKKMDKSCSEGGKVVASGRRIERNTEERGEKTDIRNWLKKNEPVDKGFPMKVKEEANEETGIVLVDITEGDEEVGQAKENTDIEIVDLEEELKNKDVKTVTNRQEMDKRKVVIQRGPLDEVLSKRTKLKRRDFQTLSGREFLNDRIIDEYMRLIRKRNGADSSLPVVYACMTHLHTGIILRGLEHTETWVKADL